MTRFIPEPHLLDSPRHRGLRGVAPSLAASARPPGKTDVVVVGGGLAGLGMVAALWHRDVRDVTVLDESGRLCGRFFGRVDMLGQRVMRSPYEHHPGAEGFRDCELLDFARLHWSALTPVERREIRMAQAGHRSVVPVDVFEAYCDHVAAVHEVSERTWHARADELRPAPDSVIVRTGDAEVRAGYAVLCLGEGRRPAPAHWWDVQPPAGVSYWDEPVPDGPERIAVIGAGLTAAHVVARSLGAGRRVAWIFRAAAEHYQCSDVNAAFFRPEGRTRFERAAWHERLRFMRAQRKASVMFEFQPLLSTAEDTGRLSVHRGQGIGQVSSGSAGPVVQLESGQRVAADHVVLALGTMPSAGEQLLPADVIAGSDGWPDLDERNLAYRRAPRVFAVGAAAGMVLGPAARNVDGHRAASGRVAAAIAAGLRDA